MPAKALWIISGGLFGALLSFAIGNSPIGVAIGAFLGAIAGYVAKRVQS